MMEEKKEATNKNAVVESQRFLFFSVDGTDYGIEIELVQEIIGIQEVSPIPSAKPFCKGVINIRGTIVPVLDMRLKMGMAAVVYDECACIIVVMIDGERIGVIVDKVQDVIQIRPESLQESPVKGDASQKRCIASKIANVNGTIKQILDVNKLFDIEQGAS